MATIDDIAQGVEKIAGHKVPTWAGAATEDLEGIVNVNMQKQQHVIQSQPEVPGRCSKCRNPLTRCICNG